MRERIRRIIRQFNLTQSEFASKIGITQGSVSLYLTGDSKNLSADVITTIIAEFGINANWLLTGKGEMFLPQETETGTGGKSRRDRIISALPESDRREIDEYIEYRATKAGIDTSKIKDAVELYSANEIEPDESASLVKERTPLYKPKPPLPTEFELKRLGRIAAGIPFLAEENFEGTVIVDAGKIIGIKPENLFLLEVSGMSMKNANILDGDMVVLEKVVSARDQVRDGDIVSVLIDNEATLKRIFFLKDGLELRPENSEFDSIFLAGEDKERVTVQGKWVLTLRGGSDTED